MASSDFILSEIADIVDDLENIDQKTKHSWCQKLVGYIPVLEIYKLQFGQHVRWIRTSTPVSILTNGGIVVDVKIMKYGALVVCKNARNQFIQYKWDDCITFQKLSHDELLLLFSEEFIIASFMSSP